MTPHPFRALLTPPALQPTFFPMSDDLQTRADERLARRLTETGAPDPRGNCRRLLRELRERSEEAYQRAVEQYRTSVLPQLAEGGDDPIAVWIAYGARLAALLEEGRTVAVDGTGRARAYQEGLQELDRLVVHLPSSKRGRPILVAEPVRTTGAQEATRALLIEGKQRLEPAS